VPGPCARRLKIPRLQKNLCDNSVFFRNIVFFQKIELLSNAGVPDTFLRKNP
jgi:hypothetical protein